MGAISFANSSVENYNRYNSFLAGNPATAISMNGFELIQTVSLTSDGEGLLFTNIPQDYAHLHLRYVARSSNTSTDNTTLVLRPNNVSSPVYSWHGVSGSASGASVNSVNTHTSMSLGSLAKNGSTANAFSAGTVDIMDYRDTSKLTTFLGFSTSANTSDYIVRLNSGLYQETSAITSMSVLSGSNAFVAGSRFTLFGVKG